MPRGVYDRTKSQEQRAAEKAALLAGVKASAPKEPKPVIKRTYKKGPSVEQLAAIPTPPTTRKHRIAQTVMAPLDPLTVLHDHLQLLADIYGKTGGENKIVLMALANTIKRSEVLLDNLVPLAFPTAEEQPTARLPKRAPATSTVSFNASAPGQPMPSQNATEASPD